MRNYSLSSASRPDGFRISVKREAQGTVSRYLHGLKEGDAIEVGPPCGEFFFDPGEHHERPLVFLSAGVGVTPLLAMLESALLEQPRREVIFIHGALNFRTHAFRQHLADLAASHPNLKIHVRYSKPSDEDRQVHWHDSEGFIDAELIESLIPRRDCEYYFCGPKPFMSAIYRQLMVWGIPSAQVHFEFFGPRQELEAAGA